MGLAQQFGTALAAVSIGVGAETSRAEVDFESTRDLGAITTTYTDQDRDTDLAQLAQTQSQDVGGVDFNAATAEVAVAAEPPTEGPGSLLRRARERDNPKPAAEPTSKPEDKPIAPAAATPVAPAAVQPVTPDQSTGAKPAEAATPEVKPEAKPEVKAEQVLWKPLTQEQIEKLTPAEMLERITDLQKRVFTSATDLKVSQDQALFYSQVNQILSDHKGEGASAQLKALNDFFGEGFRAERAGLDERERNLKQVEKDAGANLINGIPRPIVDVVNALNQNREALRADLGNVKTATDDAIRDKVMVVDGRKQELARGYRDLAGVNFQVPGELIAIGDIFKSKETTERERAEAEKKAAAERAKELEVNPIFKPLKELQDPAADPSVVAALKPIDLAEAAALVMGPSGGKPLTPGEMRAAIIDLQAKVAAATLETTEYARQIAEGRKTLPEAVVGGSTPDNPTLQRVGELAKIRTHLSSESVRLDQEQERVYTPQMSPDQEAALQTYYSIENQRVVDGWTRKDQVIGSNFEKFNAVDARFVEWSTAEQQKFDRWAALRAGNLGGAILGR